MEQRCQILCGPDCAHTLGCMNATVCLKPIDGTKQPASAQEFMLRHYKNYQVTGLGMDVATHMPCPGCAAKNWLVFKLPDTMRATSAGRVCEECHRGFRAVYQVGGGITRFEMVQTVGPALPDWHQPPMRRLGADA